jgi:hypothetical protein
MQNLWKLSEVPEYKQVLRMVCVVPPLALLPRVLALAEKNAVGCLEYVDGLTW